MIIEDTDYREEEIDLDNQFDVKVVADFLKELGFIFYPESVDFTILLYNLKGDLIGTGSCQNNLLKYVVIAPKFRETTAFSKVTSILTERLISNYKTIFVCTRPTNIIAFEGIGFKHVASSKPLFALLEYGLKSVCCYQKKLETYKQEHKTDNIASIVVNCNPFTNGHKYLIEKAAKDCEWLYLFVVQEDFSVFPFEIRWKLIKEGISHLDNVVMVPGGDYVVSGKTFPFYFLNEVDEAERIAKQAELDIEIFRTYITDILGITKRYVGTELSSKTTAAYNCAMKKMLPEKGIELIEINRLQTVAKDKKQSISASKIREAIKNSELSKYREFLPDCTRDFLFSTESESIRNKIIDSNSRH